MGCCNNYNDLYRVGIRTCSDYSPFGVELDGRTVSGGYRYGFNGMEADDEVKEGGNSYDFGLRVFDPRVARMLSIDPRCSEYPWQTTFTYHRNSPIKVIDFKGGGDEKDPVGQPHGKVLALPSDIELKNTSGAAQTINSAVEKILGDWRYKHLEDNPGEAIEEELFLDDEKFQSNKSIKTSTEIDGTGNFDDYDVVVSAKVTGMVILPSPGSGTKQHQMTEISNSSSSGTSEEVGVEVGVPGGSVLTNTGESHSASTSSSKSDGKTFYTYDVMLKSTVSVWREKTRTYESKEVWIRAVIRTQTSYTVAETKTN